MLVAPLELKEFRREGNAAVVPAVVVTKGVASANDLQVMTPSSFATDALWKTLLSDMAQVDYYGFVLLPSR